MCFWVAFQVIKLKKKKQIVLEKKSSICRPFKMNFEKKKEFINDVVYDRYFKRSFRKIKFECLVVNCGRENSYWLIFNHHFPITSIGHLQL